jgi:hypothetical protein
LSLQFDPDGYVPIFVPCFDSDLPSRNKIKLSKGPNSFWRTDCAAQATEKYDNSHGKQETSHLQETPKYKLGKTCFVDERLSIIVTHESYAILKIPASSVTMSPSDTILEQGSTVNSARDAEFEEEWPYDVMTLIVLDEFPHNVRDNVRSYTKHCD